MSKPTLGVHIIGPGYGELIVIELPNGRFGLIDCFRAPPLDPKDRDKPPPPLQFIRQRNKAVPLAFLAVTHPHLDHCNDAHQILAKCGKTVHEAWLFGAWNSNFLAGYYKRLAKLWQREDIEEALAVRPGTTFWQIHEFEKRLDALRAASRPSRPHKRYILDRNRELDLGDGVTCKFLAPGDDAKDRYEGSLKAYCRAQVTGGAGKVNHNLASGVLMLKYGDTVVILPGDAETATWGELLGDHLAEIVNCKLCILKVAHHGSPNGYHDALWDALAPRTTVIAVVTPFQSRPASEIVSKMVDHASLVAVTNRFAAKAGSDFEWHGPAGTGAAGPLPPEWITEIFNDDKLLDVLRDHWMVPRWAHDVASGKSAPTFFGGIDVRTSLWKAPEDTYRVSLYAHPNGQEFTARRYVGAGAGIAVREAAMTLTPSG